MKIANYRQVILVVSVLFAVVGILLVAASASAATCTCQSGRQFEPPAGQTCEQACVAEGGVRPEAGRGRVILPNLLGSENLIQIINRVIDAVWPVATVVVMVMVLWAGYILLFSGGVPARVQRAKDTLLWTVVGYAIIWLAKGIAFIIQDIIVQGTGRVAT